MNDIKNIEDMKLAIRLYVDGAIIEALDILENVSGRIRDFIAESEDDDENENASLRYMST